jgi:hypothetical protein
MGNSPVPMVLLPLASGHRDEIAAIWVKSHRIFRRLHFPHSGFASSH